MKNLIIRKATSSDAPLLAHVVAEAIGMPYVVMYAGENYISTLTAVACSPHTQYSFRRALIAEMDGSPVGAVIGYDGASLPKLRDETLRVIAEQTGLIHFLIDDETTAGEFYIDSIAVLSQYRGHGIGRALLNEMMQRAFADGHAQVGLLVDPDNLHAEKFYQSIGFVNVDERPFFGIMMHHLQCRNVGKE